MRRKELFDFMFEKMGAPEVVFKNGKKSYNWWGTEEGEIVVYSFCRNNRIFAKKKILSTEYPLVCFLSDINLIYNVTRAEYEITIGGKVIC